MINTTQKYICSDCAPHINFAEDGKEITTRVNCCKCNRRGMCIKLEDSLIENNKK